MSLKQKLFFVFVFLAAIIFILGASARFAFIESERAMARVLHNSRLLSQLNIAKSNLTQARNIPFELEFTIQGIDELEQRVFELQKEFNCLSHTIEEMVQDENEKVQTDAFIRTGKGFYQALEEFFPIKLEMMAHYSHYQGEIVSLPDVLMQREFAHVKFIQELHENVNNNRRIREGLDYRSCGLYLWSQDNTFNDETVNEVLEEMAPLHIKLHETAAEIDSLIARGEHYLARYSLTAIHQSMRQLGRLFSGLTRYSQKAFQKGMGKYKVQERIIQELYDESARNATRLTDYLEKSILQSAVQEMEMTAEKGERFIYATSALGILLCLLLGSYSSRRADRAIRDKESANSALSYSLDEQVLTNHQLEEEIVKRKQIEADLQNANEILAKVAVTDGLTGLFNHRHMKKSLEYEWQRAKRFDQELAVLMLDIDYFKKVNDTYGHGCGDKILQEMAALFRQRIRFTDTLGLNYNKQDTMVARYGGEEMVAILPNTSIFGATAVAEELRKSVENMVFICADEEIRITISVGVAVNSSQGDEGWQDLLERADAALYNAKESGRNRVIGDVGRDEGEDWE